MPYDGEDLSMLIILPKWNALENIEKSINPQKLSDLKDLLNEQRADIYIPKFKFETKSSLAKILSTLGMPTAFAEGADFSGMDGSKSLFIGAVLHQAFVEVNEEGTEAAAATGVIMVTTSEKPKPKISVFRADHPFIFIIQQKDTGNILFLGRVSNPSE